MNTDLLDAMILRQAVEVLRQRSTKPKSFWLDVICKVLTVKADKLQSASRHPQRSVV